MTLTITDLELSQDLDKAAMARISGGYRVAGSYAGSSRIYSSGWRFTGRTYRFVGNVRFRGRWTSKYVRSDRYRRSQYHTKYYSEWHR